MMVLAWVSIALVGAGFIIGSLAIGRAVLRALVSVPVKHDVYAFGMGFCICSSGLEMCWQLRQRLMTQPLAIVLCSLWGRAQNMAKGAVVVLFMGG